MKSTVIAGWVLSLFALLTMFIGHLGKHDFNWISNQISTFAAKGPHDTCITISMFLSASALVCISILISKYQMLGKNYFVYFIPITIGAVISGLIVLALFEETAQTIKALKNSTFIEIRQQSFHDAGLMVFFYCSVCLAVLSGILCTVFRKRMGERILGVFITILGPISFLLMTTNWPETMGVSCPSTGLKQRASLLCIWISMILLLSIASNISLKRDRESSHTL